MKRIGVEKAISRFECAKIALEDAKAAKSHFDFSRGWSEFLVSVDTIYNCLGQSTEGKKESKDWFKCLNYIRKSDELLHYLWQARNADSHGILPSADYSPAKLMFGGEGDKGFSRSISMRIDIDPVTKMQRIRAIPLDGKEIYLEQVPPNAKLLPVQNRGTYFQPPKFHLGIPIEGHSAFNIGDLALEYFAKRLEEAKDLIA